VMSWNLKMEWKRRRGGLFVIGCVEVERGIRRVVVVIIIW
jgi:hypothetical protein